MTQKKTNKYFKVLRRLFGCSSLFLRFSYYDDETFDDSLFLYFRRRRHFVMNCLFSYIDNTSDTTCI